MLWLFYEIDALAFFYEIDALALLLHLATTWDSVEN
jgi:hypothetical protein